MTDSSLRSISLFFALTLLDEKPAVVSAQEAVHWFQGLDKGENGAHEKICLVQATHHIWQKRNHNQARSNLKTHLSRLWRIPRAIPIQPWIEFHSHSTEEELMTFVWCKVLGISELEVANGLGVSEGTIQYQVGRALRKLGDLL